jgi:hypothetical protein
MSNVVVHYNGRKNEAWNTDPESLDELMRLIETEALVPSLAPYVSPSPRNPGMVQIFGNFVNVSHAFMIETDDLDLVARFGAALRANPKA